MTELTRLLYRELYKRDFYEFVKAFWHEADASKLVDGQLVKFYCETFQYMCRQWTINYHEKEICLPKISNNEILIDIRGNKHNINICVPPRHSKSMIFNVLGPVWLWLSKPIKAASISHTGSLAAKMNSERQKLINSELFQSFFSDIQLISNTASSLKDIRGGELYSLNRNSFTGYGGDIIINDDLTSAETARKDKAEMENAWSYYQNTMPSRINDINKCIILNIQQRLAPNDITGHILNDEKLSEQYIFVTLPAIFEKTTYVVCPISGTIIKWNAGDTLWPERFGNYESLKIQVGDAIFQTQYLQKPIASDKTVIKETMIITKDASEIPDISFADMIYASHDFPVKDKETSDFLGSVLAYKIGGTLYIIDCLEKKMAFKRSVEYVTQIDTLYAGSIQIIEDKANGSPILQQLQDIVPGLQAFQPGSASKMQRLESASLYMNNVVFVKNKFNKFTNEYCLSEQLLNLKKRLIDFPFVSHDDIVDAFSMLLLYVFMDRRYCVYGRAFNDSNIVDASTITGLDYSTIFFNKEGDFWKVCDIAVKYSSNTKLIMKREISFKASVSEGLNKLKEFAPTKTVFIDCSATDALKGISQKSTTVERYVIEDFDSSVAKLNLAFDKKLFLIDKSCMICKADLDSFKFSKTKDENVKYNTTKDGMIACLRIALIYYGGII